MPRLCDLDHEKQERELDILGRGPGDDEPWHHRLLAEGIETESHGPLYSVALERSGGRTRLYVSVESITLGADQAEVLGTAIVRGAGLLRTCNDASAETLLTNYWTGKTYVRPAPTAVEPTAAERALSAGA